MISTLRELMPHLVHVNVDSQIAIIAGDHTYTLERLVIDVSGGGVLLICKPVELNKTQEPNADKTQQTESSREQSSPHGLA